jgi:hypothetical protein
LHTYLAGGSTPVTTYKTSSGSGGAAHTNPIILDSNGLPPAPIWLTQGATYKFVLAPPTDTTPPVSAILTFDNVSALNDVADVVTTEWTLSGMTPTYVSATSFTVTGDQATTLNVNRRLKLTVTAGTVYATIIQSSYNGIFQVTTVQVLTDSGSLDSGLSAFSYGIVNAANTSLPFLSRDQQCGRLVYVSATQVRLDPQDGNTIWVYTGAAGWTRRTIPSAGVTSGGTNSGLSADTFYYVYLFDNVGVLWLEFSATAPAVDAPSGLKIKTGDPTRLLIGMVRTKVASNQFDTPGLVLSWYKRRAIKASAAFTTARTTTSTSFVEVNAEIEVRFLSWAEEALLALFTGYVSNTTDAQVTYTQITLDGIVTAFSSYTAIKTITGNSGDNNSIGGMVSTTEGYHYATIAGKVSANTGTWSEGTLYVMTRG